MIGTPITIKNHDTGEEIILNDHVTDESNVIALQSFPSFESDIRASNQPRQGAHGEFRLPYYYSGMSIVLQGVIVGEGANEGNVWEIKKQFDQIMKMSRSGYAKPNTSGTFPPMSRNTVRLSFTTPSGENVFIDATPIKAVSYDRPLKQKFLLNFQVILRANFPYLLIVDDVANVETGSLGSIVKGFQLGTSVPFSLGESQVTGEMTITMEAPGFAQVTLNGSDDGLIINPKITNLTNGSEVQINRVLNGAQEHFVIDGVYQTMKDQNGNNVEQYSEGDYIHLDAGDNVLVYTADKIIPN